jgi:DNA-binding GntR family transcriptional regulator
LVRSVYEVRMVMEPEALRHAVRRGARFAEAAEALAEAKKESAEAQDAARLSLINRRFHRSMYVGCGNPLMVRILDDLRDQTALITVAGWGIRPTWDTEIVEHGAVLAAAEAGDADRAAELMRRHIQAFADRVVEELPHGA